MNSTELQLRRQETAATAERKSFARELAAGLQLLRFRGTCKCGLMLTNRDQNQPKDTPETTYSCPHCGRTGLLMKLVCDVTGNAEKT
jgi:hypothetical protein